MTKDKQTSTVTADVKRNRLMIRLRGTVSRKSVERIYTDVRFCVADLAPGFAVITDLSEASIGHLSGIDIFIKITKYLTEKKVGPVIRVVGQAKLIFTQLAKLSQHIGGYQPMYAKTMEEAEVILTDLAENHRQAG
jgi:hypothetical protein